MSTSITVATEDMEVTPYLPTLCYTSRVIVTTPMLIPCIARVASQRATVPVTTLFDTGANPTSFVNKRVATWIEPQQSPQALGKRKHSPVPSAAASLAGTSHSSPIYGSVVFNLTFFNEVTRSNETLYRLHANVIVSRPAIREHHLITSMRRRALNPT
jgi:hypothetical protein